MADKISGIGSFLEGLAGGIQAGQQMRQRREAGEREQARLQEQQRQFDEEMAFKERKLEADERLSEERIKAQKNKTSAMDLMKQERQITSAQRLQKDVDDKGVEYEEEFYATLEEMMHLEKSRGKDSPEYKLAKAKNDGAKRKMADNDDLSRQLRSRIMSLGEGQSLNKFIQEGSQTKEAPMTAEQKALKERQRARQISEFNLSEEASTKGLLFDDNGNAVHFPENDQVIGIIQGIQTEEQYQRAVRELSSGSSYSFEQKQALAKLLKSKKESNQRQQELSELQIQTKRNNQRMREAVLGEPKPRPQKAGMTGRMY